MRWLRLLVVSSIVGVVLLLAAPFSTISAAPTLSPVVIWVSEEYHSGGAYTAIQAAPDGRVYIGTTFYDEFARLLVLPRGSFAVQLITDMATATGEATPGPFAQAKIHTKPAIAPDGKVYFATKSGKPAKDPQWQANYPGGHLLVYNPQTNRVTDLGIPRPRQSIIAVGADPKRNLVYALTDPEGHLILYDPRTRIFTDKGKFAGDFPTRYLVVLANGDTFHFAGADAYMRYDASSGRIERLPLRFSGPGRYDEPYATTPNSDGIRFHGLEGSGQVFTFTLGDHAIDVYRHGAILPEGYHLPGTHYTMTNAPDGKIYYTSVLDGGAPEGTLFIMRLVPTTGRLEVVGQVPRLPTSPPQPGRFASNARPAAKELLIEGSTAGPDGTLYIMTAYPLRILVFPRLAAP